MKNIYLHNILYLFIVFLFSSCYPTEVHETINRTKYIEIETEIIVKHINNDRNFKIVTIDSCEYITWNPNPGYTGSGGGICHKENCKYCTKRALEKAN